MQVHLHLSTIIPLLILSLLAAVPSPAHANKFCPGVPRRSLWSRLTEREIIVTPPAEYLNKDAANKTPSPTRGWWLSDGKIGNTSLSILNDGRGLTSSDPRDKGITSEKELLDRRWVPDCGTTNIVCGT